MVNTQTVGLTGSVANTSGRCGKGLRRNKLLTNHYENTSGGGKREPLNSHTGDALYGYREEGSVGNIIPFVLEE